MTDSSKHTRIETDKKEALNTPEIGAGANLVEQSVVVNENDAGDSLKPKSDRDNTQSPYPIDVPVIEFVEFPNYSFRARIKPQSSGGAADSQALQAQKAAQARREDAERKAAQAIREDAERRKAASAANKAAKTPNTNSSVYSSTKSKRT